MNKRQRKKQIKQQKIQFLTRRDIDRRKARDLARPSKEREYKRTITTIRTKEKRDERFRTLLEAGYTRSEAHKLKSRSDANIKKLASQKQRSSRAKALREQKYTRLITAGLPEREAKALSGKSWDVVRKAEREAKGYGSYLIVSYKEKTEQYSQQDINDFKMGYKRDKRSTTAKMDSAMGMLTEEFGYIGDYKLSATDDADRTTRYHYGLGYHQLYRGKGENYGPLITLIDQMMVLLYKPYEKYEFIRELVKHLRMLDSEKAHVNADRIADAFL